MSLINIVSSVFSESIKQYLYSFKETPIIVFKYGTSIEKQLQKTLTLFTKDSKTIICSLTLLSFRTRYIFLSFQYCDLSIVAAILKSQRNKLNYNIIRSL